MRELFLPRLMLRCNRPATMNENHNIGFLCTKVHEAT